MSIWRGASSCCSRGSLWPTSATLSRRPRPYRFHAPPTPGSPPHRPAYNFDGCTPEVLLTRMKVKDGRLVLPSGMSYRVLVAARGGDDDAEAAAQDQRAGEGRRDGGGAGAGEVAEPLELPAVRRRGSRAGAGAVGRQGRGGHRFVRAGPGDLAAGGPKQDKAAPEAPAAARVGQVDLVQGRQSRGGRAGRQTLLPPRAEPGRRGGDSNRADGDDGRQRVRVVGQRRRAGAGTTSCTPT